MSFNYFLSLSNKMELKEIIGEIVLEPALHSRWLNTLSLMENTGARKIISNEHDINVTEIILKHAAEEARHAYYLKKQISKLFIELPDYRPEFLLAPVASKQYLNRLDVYTARYLYDKYGYTGNKLKTGCYLYVTYAIEVRADEIYPVYQKALEEHHSKVNVKSIILEEDGHLQEMIKQLETFNNEWRKDAEEVLRFESRLFDSWLKSLQTEINIAYNDLQEK